MSQPIPETAAARKPRHLLKWIVRALLAVVGIVVLALVIAGVLLATGLPQRYLLESQLGKALTADVKANGISILNPFRIADLKAFDKTPGADSQTPMIDLGGLTVAYSLFPKDGRYVSSVNIDKLAIDIDRSREAAAPAPAAPSARGAKPALGPSRSKRGRGNFNMSRVLPKTVDLATLDLEGALPYVGISLDGLKAKATIDSMRNYSVQVQGDHLKGSFWAGGRAAQRDLKDSAINFRYETGDKGTHIEPLKAILPGLLDIEGGVSTKKENDKTIVDIHLEKGLVQDVDLSQSAMGTVPFPFRFKKVDLSGTAIRGFGKVKGLNVQVSFDGTNISVVGEDLALGPKGHELYEGNLALLGKGGGGEQLKLDLEAVLNRGQKISASLNGTEVADMKAHVGQENWSRDDLLAALPKDSRAALDALPGLQSLSSGIDLQLAKNLSYTLNANVTPQWVDSDGQPTAVSMAFESSGSLFKLVIEQGVEGTVKAQVGAQTINATAKIAMGRATKSLRIDCKADLQQLDPRALVKTLLGKDVLAPLDLRLDGTLVLAASASERSVKAELKGLDLTALSQALPILSLTGKADGELTIGGDASGPKDLDIQATSNGALSVGTNALKALLASPSAKVAGKQSDDTALRQLLDKEGPCPLDGAKVHLSMATGGIEGQVILTSNKADYTIDLHIEPGTFADGIKVLK